jgi:hypothetical protein
MQRGRSSFRPTDDGHQLGDLPALIGLVAAGDRVLYAMGDVILQHLFFDAPERRADSGDLRHDVDAVAIIVDHLEKTPDLALDPVQTFLA